MSGINGPCNRSCKLGRPHDIDCHNYIEVDLPCPVCDTEFGFHDDECIMDRTQGKR